MKFFSRLLNNRESRKANRRSSLRRSRSFETLEDRCLLATFSISQPQDIVANDDLVSLREAVEQVNNLPNGPHTINIPDFSQDIELTQGALVITTTEPVSIAGPGSIQLTISSASSAIFETGPGATVTIDGLTLTGNSAGDGGAIRSLGSDLNIEQVRFANNNASGNGGAIYLSGGSLTINAATFTHNNAFNGGAIYVDGGSLTADFPFISNNEASANGGGIYLRSSTASIAGSGGGGGWINDNSAAIDGGGMFVAGGTVQVSGLLIDNNTADRDGGGIAVVGGSLEIIDAPLTNNSATELGGGLAVDFDSSFSLLPPQVALQGSSRIAFNTADAGGGVSLNATDFTLEGSAEVADNESVRHGGGVFAQNATMELRGTIRDNKAGDFGGGVYTVSGRTQFTGASVTGNQAISGGGLFANTVTDGDSATLELSIFDSFFAANSAASSTTERIGGGGIHLANTGNVLIDQTIITGSNGGPNTGGGLGGGLLVENSGGDVRIQRSSIINAVANDGGGAAVFGSGQATTTFLQTTISGNRSTISEYQVNARGGGVFLDGGTTRFLHSTITGNSVPQSGGGISVVPGSTVLLDHTIVAANTAPTDSAPDIAGTVDAQYSLVGDDTGAVISAGFANIVGQSGQVIDPRLGPLADYGGPVLTHLPLLNSPVVNAGDPAFESSSPALDFDQRGGGFARVAYDRIDIGATELQDSGIKLKVDNVLDEVDDDFSAGQLSLREAILIANYRPGPDTISIAESLAGETVSLQSGELLITDDVTIDGPSEGRLLINGNSASRILNVDDEDAGTSLAVELTQLELFAGQATGTGGDGGAILSREQLTLRDVVIRNNQADGHGGGIAALDGALTIETSTIDNNTAAGDGGGIYTAVPTSADRSTFSRNDAQGAGGGLSGLNNLTISSSTVSGNHSIGSGGGINVGARAAVVTHTTITDNASDASPGGGGIFADAPVTLDHTIVAVNSLRGDDDLHQTQFGSFEAAFSVIGSNGNANLQDNGGNIIGSSQTPLNPILQPLGDYGGPTQTHALDSRSLALHAGDASIVAPPAEDQRGFTRITGTRIDIGAVEYQGNLLVVNTLLDIVDGDTVSIGSLLQDSGTDGQISLREAILAANNTPGSDEIHFASTLDKDVITVTLAGSPEDSGLTGDLDITDDVTIIGNGSTSTLIDATGLLDRIFDIHPDTVVTISGISISGAVLKEGDYGGGILVNSSTLSLSGVRVAENEARYGGGIAVVGAAEDAVLHVERSEIIANSAGNSGGGIAVVSGIKDNTSSVHIVASTIADNEAPSGGGLLNDARSGGTSLARIDSSTLSQNRATDAAGRGGGILNTATIGFGEVATAGLTLSNSTLSENSSAYDGGGIYNDAVDPSDRAVVVVRNATVMRNDAFNAGGGIFNATIGLVSELHNTILAGNTAKGGEDLADEGILSDVTHNLIESSAGHSITDGTNGNLVGRPAGIGALADNGGVTATHALLPGSLAIDGGVNAEALDSGDQPLTTDQRGGSFGRMIRGTVDIGATEFVFRDYGDAPDAAPGTGSGNYQTRADDNGPTHILFSGTSSTVSLFLGATVDDDNGTGQNAHADADDVNGALPDDEDGVLRPLIDLALVEGTSPQVTLSVTNLTGADALLAGWIDYNGDGIFNVNTEQATAIVPDGTSGGLVTLSFPNVPMGSAAHTYARFRLSTDADFTATPSPVGEVLDGEVEDYAVTITVPPSLVAPVAAAPLHSMTHFTDTYNSSTIPPGGMITDSSEPIVYDFPFQSVDRRDRNYSEVHVQVGPGFVDVFDWAYNAGAYAPQRQEVYATFKFDAFFESPNDTPISVALNLDITGVIDAYNGTVQIAAGSGSTQFGYGAYNSITGGEYFLSNFTADNTTQTITTQTLSNVAVNTPVTFYVNVRTINGYRPTSDVIDVSVSLTRSGDVFRLYGPDADSIVVTSTDVGIDNNRIQPRAVVPIPHKVSDTSGNFTGELRDGDHFGGSIADIGDFDGDGVRDMAVGAPLDDDGSVDGGAVWILLMNADGTVRDQTKISSLTEPALNFTSGEQFGTDVASLGDLNGDGITDIAVGSPFYEDSGSARPGAVRILFLNADGTVASQSLLSSNITPLALDDLDSFGSSITNLGDVNGDGISDLGVGAPGDDDRGVDAGALHLLLLDAVGNAVVLQKARGLEAGDLLGSSVSTLGDLDGDGITEYAVGVPGNDGAGLDRGVAWIVFLNSDGRIHRRVTIGQGSGGFAEFLDDGSKFGRAVAGVGDLNGDGVNDAIVGERNRAWILLLNSNGTVANAYRVENPDSADGGDFGAGLSSLGDLTQDGFIDVAIGAPRDNDGGPERGAFYILEFGEADTTPPVAIVTGPPEVVQYSDIALDGSGSFDAPPGEIEIYRWRRVGGLLDGHSIIDTSDPALTVSTVGYEAGTQTFELVTIDSAGNQSAPASVDVVIIPPSADLHFAAPAGVEVVSGGSVAVGEQLRLTLTPENLGPLAATNAQLHFTLPAGLVFDDVSVDGIFNPNVQITGELISVDLEMAELSARDVELLVTVTEAGLWTVDATLSADEPDLQPGNNNQSILIIPESLVVDTTDDIDNTDFSAGDLSLREAIQLANADAFRNTISFSLSSDSTITLTAGELPTIVEDVIIEGPGAEDLAVGDNPTATAFRIDNDADVEISGLTIRGGQRGIENFASLTINETAITNNINHLQIVGGGIYNRGTLSLISSTVNANFADGGGGGIWSGGELTTLNSTISGNEADFGGGVLLVGGTSATFINATIVDNRANFSGGIGIGATSPPRLTLHSTIVADNTVIDNTGYDQINGTLDSSSSHNVIGLQTTYQHLGIYDGVNGNQIGVAFPQLGPLADNGGPTWTHALLGGSPALDAGSIQKAIEAGITTDQRGEDRFRDGGLEAGRIDIGAFEAVATPSTYIVTTELDEDDGGLGVGLGDSLREVIKAANDNVGADTILFDAGLAPVIVLTTGGLPTVVDEVSITGPGATNLAVGDNPSATIFRVDNDAHVELSGLTIRGGNRGIENFGSLTVFESSITGHVNQNNNAEGGGIQNVGTLRLENSTVANNFAGGGAGIWTLGDLTVLNSTISSNTAGYGGGLGLFEGSVLLTGVTLADNDGGGISKYGGILTLHNTIVADNVSSEPYGQIDGFLDPSSSSNIIGVQDVYQYLGIDDGVNGNQIGVEFAQLGPLADNGGPTWTHALLGSSPAIDAGSNQKATEAALTTDQRGEDRFRHGGLEAGRTDIGAYEALATPTTFVVTTELDEDDGSLSVGAGDSLREVINAANDNIGVDTILFDAGLAPVITLTAGGLPTIVDDVSITGPGAKNLTVGDNASATIFQVENDAIVEISGLTIRGGRQGVHNFGTLTLLETAVSENHNDPFPAPNWEGGGIRNHGTLTLESSTVDNNVADSGSGIWSDGSLWIVNSTISSNQAESNGGGIFVPSGQLTVVNSTIANNTGSGIVNGIRATLHNTIVALNTSTNAFSQINGSVDESSSHNLIGPQSPINIFNGVNGNQIGVQFARLGPLADNGGPTMTHALLGGSPAIDAGSNQKATEAALTTDQRGEDRFRHGGLEAGRTDIGAYEALATPTTFVVTTELDEDDGSLSVGAGDSLREVINAANDNIGVDTILFDAGLAPVITLTAGGLPTIVDDVSITGPGAKNLTVGDNASATIFQVENDAIVEISGLTIRGGRQGVHNFGTLTLLETAISENHNDPFPAPNWEGGGIRNHGTLTLESSTVDNNVADSGSGIWSDGSLWIVNSTISSNQAESNGGGIFVPSGQLTVVNSTIANNTGSGIVNGIRATLHNTIVALNTSTNAFSQINGSVDESSSHNLIGPQSPINIFNGVNGNQIGVQFARLGPLADNGGPTLTHALLGGSPAIDTGSNTQAQQAGLIFDQRGDERFVDSGIGSTQVDIGAFEFRDVTPPTAVLIAPAAIPVGQDLILDGTASLDNHSAPLTYRWSRVGGLINGQTSVTTTTPHLSVWSDDMPLGRVRFSLVVIDAVGNASVASFADVQIEDSLLPTAILVAPSEVSHGAGLLLDGSRSFDPPPGQIVGYRWSRAGGLINGQSSITTSTWTLLAATDTFELGTETFSLQVIDGEGNVSASVSTEVQVVDTKNPVAVLVAPPSVGLGTDLLLDGSGSIDPAPGQITEYRWSRVGGLISGQTVITTTSPTLVVSTDDFLLGTETFSLQVADAAGNVSVLATSSVDIIDDLAPTAVLQAPQSVFGGDDFLLDGSASIDAPPGEIVEYRWSRTGGLINGQTSISTTTPTLLVSSDGLSLGTQSFVLQVVDGAGNISSPATATVQIVDGLLITVTTIVDEDDGALGVGEDSLREALETANARSGQNIIEFAPDLGGTIELLGTSLNILDDVFITGPGADVLTVMGRSGIRVFQIADSVEATISDLTITGGRIVGGGSGINNFGTLTLDHVVIAGNEATLFSRGAGIYNRSSGDLTILNSTIRDNIAGTDGGGIFNGGSLFIANSTLNANSARNGGGIGNSGTLDIVNSTISGNLAQDQGGGIENQGGSVQLVNVTITNNRADTDSDGSGLGGGIATTNSNFTAHNTIVAGNFTGTATANSEIAGTLDPASSHNLIGTLEFQGDHGGLSGVNGNLFRPLDVALGLLTDNGGPTQTHAVRNGSPALDAGDSNRAVLANLFQDQRGFGRLADVLGSGRTVDIGAFEAYRPALLQSLADVTLDEGDPPVVQHVSGLFFDPDGQPGELTWSVADNTNSTLVEAQLDGDELTLTLRQYYSGVATITVRATDPHGHFFEDSFDVTVQAVNDAPSFTTGNDIFLLGDSNTVTLPGWATDISAGPNEETQTLSFQVVDVSDPDLFEDLPTLSPDGTLQYTPVSLEERANATITVQLVDDGGTAFGGDDTSDPQSFEINLFPPIVTTLDDQNDLRLGAGNGESLREILAAANAVPGTTTITFDTQILDLPVIETISLQHGALEVLDDAIIQAPSEGLPGLATIGVSALDESRVFEIGSGVEAELAGLRVTQGRVEGDGGGILNLGTLTLRRTIVDRNYAIDGWGGGILNAESGTLHVFNSAFHLNRAMISNSSVTGLEIHGGAIANRGTLTISGSAPVGFFEAQNSNGESFLGLNNNHAYGDGGAVYNAPLGVATLDDVSVVNSFAGRNGGAIFNSDTATTDLSGSIITGSFAYGDGGGIFNAGTFNLFDTTIGDRDVGGDFSNTALGDGGGILNTGTLTVVDSTIGRNEARASGAALYNTGAARVESSAITHNNATVDGGGIFNVGQLVAVNSTVSGNVTRGRGGGVHNETGGTASFTHLTVVRNSVDWDGPIDGSAGSGISTVLPDVTLHNSIVAENSAVGTLPAYQSKADNVFGILDPESSHNIVEARGYYNSSIRTDYGDLDLALGNQVIVGSTPVRLADLADNGGPTKTHELLSTSLALDAGDINRSIIANLQKDQRGADRLQNGGSGVAQVDIGAFEATWAHRTHTVDTIENDGDGLSFDDAVQRANDSVGPDTIQFDLPVGATIVQRYFQGPRVFRDSYDPLTIIGPGADKLTVETPEPTLVDPEPEVDSTFVWYVYDASRQFSGSQPVVTIEKLTFRGGGLVNQGTLTLRDVIVTAGRGIVNKESASLNISGSTISHNVSDEGGGILNRGQLFVTNSTISRNLAEDGVGGGLFVDEGGTAELVNTTIAENVASDEGGGVFAGQQAVRLRNTIVFDNVSVATPANDISGDVEARYSLIGDTNGSTFTSDSIENVIKVTSVLGPLADNGGPTPTHSLLLNSSARDNGLKELAIGLANDILEVDQRGADFQRVVGSQVDIGAFEAGPGPSIANLIDDEEMLEDAEKRTLDLSSVFHADAGTPVLSVSRNTNPELIDTSLSDASLTLRPLPDQFGHATIVIRATDQNGAFVEDEFDVYVRPVNDLPTFSLPVDFYVEENKSATQYPNVATGLSTGPVNESEQSLVFEVLANTNPGLFATPPSFHGGGALRIDSAPNQAGTATLTVRLMDDGGTANGGEDTTAPQSITIHVIPEQLLVTTAADEDDGNLGLGAGDSLREVIQAANRGTAHNTIEFATDIGSVIELSSGEGLTISQDVSILGPGADQLSVGDAPDATIFRVRGSADVMISGVTVRGGKAGIVNSAHLQLDDVVVTEHHGEGGIATSNVLEVNRSVISNNSSFRGAGIRAQRDLRIVDSQITGNVSTGPGGGLFLYSDPAAPSFGGHVEIIRSTIDNNLAAHVGGGIANGFKVGPPLGSRFGGEVEVVNSTISDNAAGEAGGGVWNAAMGIFSATNSTIAANTATDLSNVYRGGGGIWNQGDATLSNTVVADNTLDSGAPDDVYGSIVANYSLIGNLGSDGAIVGSSTGTLVNVDPLLQQLQENGGPTPTRALGPGSPARNAGSNALVQDPSATIPTDQRGFSRLEEGQVDMGAYEIQVAPVVRQPPANAQMNEDASDLVIDLSGVFRSDRGQLLSFSLVGNTNDTLVDAAFAGSQLALSVLPDQFGAAMLTVRATDEDDFFVDEQFELTVHPVNDPPSFTVGPEIFAVGNAMPTAILLWATEMQPGPTNEDSQSWQFELVNVSAPELFNVVPAVTADGTLRFTSSDLTDITEPVSAEVSILLKDDGGTERGGVDQSAAATFVITFVPTTLTVTTVTDEDDGTLFAGEGNSLREVIQVANTYIGSNTIQFDLPPESVISLDNDLPFLADDVVIQGPGADQLAVGNVGGVVFSVDFDTNVEISGLTIRDSQRGIMNRGNLTVAETIITANDIGYSDHGAGIFNDGALTVSDSTISDNTARRGAGIYSEGSDVQISGTAFDRNVALERGGGIYIWDGSALITGSKIRENRADAAGGGLYQRSADEVTIISSEISFNTAGERGAGVLNVGPLAMIDNAVHHNAIVSIDGSVPDAGGGVWSERDAETVIIGNAIYANTAPDGGGIFFGSGSPIATKFIANTTISGNTAWERGGGVYGGGRFVNVTITGNHAGISAGGLRSLQTELHNSIIAANSAGSAFDEILGVVDPVSSYNLIGTGLGTADDGELSPDQHNLFFDNSAAIRLGPLEDNGGPTLTHALLGGSPAIDAGDDALSVNEFGIPLAFDQRGMNRISGVSVDIGAFELFDSDGDGVDDSIEDLGPNGGDGNADGVADSQQSHVASVRTPVDGSYVTILAPTGTSLQDASNLASPPDGVIPSDANLHPFGFLSFNVTGIAIGATIKVDVIPETTTSLPELVNTFQKYGPLQGNATPHEYQFLYEGTTGAELLSDRVRLHFVDGQRGDSDLSANGTIVDPGAPALNPAPVVEPITGLDVAVTGQPVDITTLFTDLGNESHAAVIDWGDGAVEPGQVSEATGGGSVTGAHVYGQPGNFRILVDVQDEFGNVVSVEKMILIEKLLLTDDPENPGQQILTVGGTPDRDWIDFKPKRGNRMIEVRRNGRKLGRFPTDQLSKLVAYGGSGDDRIRVHGRIDLPTEFHGGAGDDNIRGSRGINLMFGDGGDDRISTSNADDAVFGGPGNDLIWSRGGNDVIDAGAGNNRVWSGSGDDLIRSGDGNDWIFCGAGLDSVQSGGGHDRVFCARNNGKSGRATGRRSVAARVGNDKDSDELFDDWDRRHHFLDPNRKDQYEAFDEIFADRLDELLAGISL